MDTAAAVAMLLRDMPSYGDEVNAVHEQTLSALLPLPSWRIHYETLEEALGLLGELPITRG